MLVVIGVRGLSWHFVVVEVTVVDGPQYHCVVHKLSPSQWIVVSRFDNCLSEGD